MSVMEQDDSTLVTTFLIARISERWDLAGSDNQEDEGSAIGGVSVMGIRRLPNINQLGDAVASTSVDGELSKSFLRSTALTRADACDDHYMKFLIRYTLGDSLSTAVQDLLQVPKKRADCFFWTQHPLSVAEPSGMVSVVLASCL
ncbi:hypothetical protein PINS_up013483 [Pythium insidiosum]|nr:hypothetical protein PINS_up013483 [Pythium insidiosum]